MNIIRKCIALSRANFKYVSDLVNSKEVKNFSRKINTLIDEDREKQEINCEEDGND